MAAILSAMFEGLRYAWTQRRRHNANLTLTGTLRLFTVGALLSLTASSVLQFVGAFKEQYDYEMHIMPDAMKLNHTCTMIEAARLFMDANMTDSCARARYRLTVGPIWRAFYHQLPTLTTFTSTSDLVKNASGGLWMGLVALFENNKLFFFFLLLGAWGFGEPLLRLTRNALRDRFNRRRAREYERRLQLLTPVAAKTQQQQQQHDEDDDNSHEP